MFEEARKGFDIKVEILTPIRESWIYKNTTISITDQENGSIRVQFSNPNIVLSQIIIKSEAVATIRGCLEHIDDLKSYILG